VTTAEIVIIAIVAFFGLLALGGYVVNRRRAKANEPHFREQLEIANRDLAAAHAADKGWEPDALFEAARRAFTEQRAGAVQSLDLIQVVDPPGTDEDKAVFRVETDNGPFTVTMGRRGDAWHLESAG
jgi:hypothetical protein